jgi:hypothetical protein
MTQNQYYGTLDSQSKKAIELLTKLNDETDGDRLSLKKRLKRIKSRTFFPLLKGYKERSDFLNDSDNSIQATKESINNTIKIKKEDQNYQELYKNLAKHRSWNICSDLSSSNQITHIDFDYFCEFLKKNEGLYEAYTQLLDNPNIGYSCRTILTPRKTGQFNPQYGSNHKSSIVIIPNGFKPNLDPLTLNGGTRRRRKTRRSRRS